MKDYKDWFCRAVLHLNKDDIFQISSLISWYEHSKEEMQNMTYEANLNAAMLADIFEIFFKGHILGSPFPPSILSYLHAGWNCGSPSKADNECYVEWFYKLRKITNNDKEIEEWKSFLDWTRLRGRNYEETISGR